MILMHHLPVFNFKLSLNGVYMRNNATFFMTKELYDFALIERN